VWLSLPKDSAEDDNIDIASITHSLLTVCPSHSSLLLRLHYSRL